MEILQIVLYPPPQKKKKAFKYINSLWKIF